MNNFAEMKETLCESLKQKTNFEEIELVSEVLINVMCDTFCGEMLYIPKRKKYGKREQLIKKFNGHNHRELAKEFGYCVRNVYQILANHKPNS